MYAEQQATAERAGAGVGATPAERAGAGAGEVPAERGGGAAGGAAEHEAIRFAGPPAGEAADPDVIAPTASDALLAGAPWRRWVVLGDSVAEGVGDPVPGYAPVPWGDRVAAALARIDEGLIYANFGRRNLTARQVLDAQLEPALLERPDLAAVVAGGNDMLDPDFDAAATGRVLDDIVAPLRGVGADVVVFKMFDISKALEFAGRGRLRRRMEALNEQMEHIAERRSALLVDLASKRASADPGIFSADRLHANMRGHAIAASATIERLGAHLAGREAER